MGAFWPPDRGGGQGGGGGVRREADCGKPNNAKIPGGSGGCLIPPTTQAVYNLQSAWSGIFVTLVTGRRQNRFN